MTRKTAQSGLVILVLAALIAPPAFAQQLARGARPGGPPSGAQIENIKLFFRIAQMLGDGKVDALAGPFSMTDGKIFSTAQTRQAAAAEIIPSINQLMDSYQKVAPEVPDGMRRANVQYAIIFNVIKMALGDASARDKYEALASGGGADAVLAKVMLAGADYLQSGTDAAAQGEAIKRFEEAYARLDADAPVKEVALLFTLNPPAPELADDLAAFLRTDTRENFSGEAAALMTTIPGRPLTFEDTLPDGSKFSTAQWKGKVILVDFWGTQCAPCLAEMPAIESIYSAQRARGFEVLGFPSDQKLETIDAFLAKNRGISWPQIFNRANPGFGGIFGKYAILNTPSSFLIDRKGILRYSLRGGIDQNLGPEIGKLLAETP